MYVRDTARSKQNDLGTDAIRSERIDIKEDELKKAQIPPTASPVADEIPITYEKEVTVPKIDYYEQYLQSLGVRYGTIKDTAIKAAEDAKDAVYKNAAIAKERAVVDAHSAGEQNRATYGGRAEQLGAMGLSGSGYSDYLDAKAHATERAEVQSAGAQAKYAERIADENYNKAVAEANATYEQNMINAEGTLAKYQQDKADAAEAERQTKYLTMLEGISNGTITTENFSSYADALGLSAEERMRLPEPNSAGNLNGNDTTSGVYGNELPTDTYNPDGTLNMELDEANEYLEAIKKDTSIPEETKKQFEAAYTATFDTRKKAINMLSDSFTPADVGFVGANDKNSKQYKYVYAIKKAVEDGKIDEGDVVDFNYGYDGSFWTAGLSENTYYKYKGNGVFEKITLPEFYSVDTSNIFYPEGYEKIRGKVREE